MIYNNQPTGLAIVDVMLVVVDMNFYFTKSVEEHR